MHFCTRLGSKYCPMVWEPLRKPTWCSFIHKPLLLRWLGTEPDSCEACCLYSLRFFRGRFCRGLPPVNMQTCPTALSVQCLAVLWAFVPHSSAWSLNTRASAAGSGHRRGGLRPVFTGHCRLLACRRALHAVYCSGCSFPLPGLRHSGPGRTVCHARCL